MRRHGIQTARLATASIGLVALLALAGCGGNSGSAARQAVKTVTVTQSAAPVAPSKPKRQKRVVAAPAVSEGPAFVRCDANIGVKASTTTCAFAQNAFWSYWTNEEAGTLRVWSPAAQSSFDTTCTGASQVVCTTTDGAVVRFSQAAVDNYSGSQADAYAANHDLGPDPQGADAGSTDETTQPPDIPDSGKAGQNIPNYDNGNGYRVRCADGMYSHSGGIQGACSGHGGVG